MFRPKHVEQLRNIGKINSTTTRLHLVVSFYEIYITMRGSMNVNFMNIKRKLRASLINIIPTPSVSYSFDHYHVENRNAKRESEL